MANCKTWGEATGLDAVLLGNDSMCDGMLTPSNLHEHPGYVWLALCQSKLHGGLHMPQILGKYSEKKQKWMFQFTFNDGWNGFATYSSSVDPSCFDGMFPESYSETPPGAPPPPPPPTTAPPPVSCSGGMIYDESLKSCRCPGGFVPVPLPGGGMVCVVDQAVMRALAKKVIQFSTADLTPKLDQATMRALDKKVPQYPAGQPMYPGGSSQPKYPGMGPGKTSKPSRAAPTPSSETKTSSGSKNWRPWTFAPVSPTGPTGPLGPADLVDLAPSHERSADATRDHLTTRRRPERPLLPT